jgi:hypothetical protein
MDPMMANPVKTIVNKLPPFPLWLFRLLSTFPITGLLGIDHMAIGSTFTGFAKLLINVITLGSWYAYDIVQVYNTVNLRDKGLNIPFLEIGKIGVGRIDDTPTKELSKSSRSWLYLLLTLVFGLAYYISMYFITKKSDTLSIAIRFISSLFMFIFIGLTIFTALNFISPTMNLFTMPTYKTSTGALEEFYAQTAPPVPVFNNNNQAALSTILSTPTPTMFGGGYNKPNFNDLRLAAASILQEGGVKESYSHIYLTTLILLLPIAGFITYTLRKKKLVKKKKDEVSN